MATKIQWCDETWNPITGCDLVSEGCRYCYAERMANRLRGRFGYDKDDPFKVTFHKDKLDQPYHWKKPRRIFVSSMGDLFHDDVTKQDFMRVWGVMEKLTHHTFIVLTKRPKNMSYRLFNWCFGTGPVGYLPNLWLGVTCENQQAADERIPILLRIPAEVRFVSCEPMLGLISIQKYLPGLDWLIVGGETGPGARPMRASWACDLRYQCLETKTPFFFKQWGAAYEELKNLYVWNRKEFPVMPV